MSRNLVIKYNNAATNDPCGICGARTDPACGPEIFVEGTWATVCWPCQKKHAPGLAATIGVIREMEHLFGRMFVEIDLEKLKGNPLVNPGKAATEQRDKAEPFGAPEHQEDYGNCPVCGRYGEPMPMFRDDWIVCREHKLCWWFGMGGLDRNGMTMDESDRVHRILKTYKVVEPVYGLQAEQLRMQHATDDDVALAWPSLASVEQRHGEPKAGQAGARNSVRLTPSDDKGTGLPPV